MRRGLADCTLPFEQDEDIVRIQEYLECYRRYFLEDIASEDASLRDSIADSLLEEICRSEPYAICFKRSSMSALLQLKLTEPRVRDWHQPIVSREILRFLIMRCTAVSRYCIHTEFKKTKQPFSIWRQHFLRPGLNRTWGTIPSEYPVLARCLGATLHHSIKFFRELFSRFHSDRQEIQERLGISLDDEINGVNFGLSDPHNGGQVVTKLSFDSGRSILYKPKCLLLDQQLSRFFQESEECFGAAPITTFAGSGYGWVEDVTKREYIGRTESPHHLAGRMTALAWLLNSTDLHFENIWSQSGKIFIIDVETLLSANTSHYIGKRIPVWRSHSIFTTLLFRNGLSRDVARDHLSGFDRGPVLVEKAPSVRFLLEEDDIIVVSPNQSDRTRMLDLGAASDLTVNEHASGDWVRGFDVGVSSELKARLLRFVRELPATCRLRHVVRDTAFYYRLLERIRQPRFMRSVKDLHVDLIRLVPKNSRKHFGEERMESIVEDEICQLVNGDIPYFSYGIGSCDLQTSRRELRAFFSESAADLAIEKIKSHEPSDVEEQRTMLRTAVHTGTPKGEKFPDLDLNLLVEGSQSRKSLMLRDCLAQNYLAIIESASTFSHWPSRWLYLDGLESDIDVRLSFEKEGFYDGYWGTIVSIQAAELVLRDRGKDRDIKEFLDREAGIWASLVAGGFSIVQERDLSLGIGGLAGYCTAFAFLLRSNLRRWASLSALLVEVSKEMEAVTPTDTKLDVIGGAAGAILGSDAILSSIESHHLRQTSLRIISAASQRLIDSAMDLDGATCWLVPGEHSPLLGFAHGWAGIVSALGMASRRVSDADLRHRIGSTIARAALFPSRRLQTDGDWLDYRGAIAAPLPQNSSWCNGDAGVVRGLLECRRAIEPEVRHRTYEIIRNLLKQSSDGNAQRFCCGAAGIVDMLIDFREAKEAREFRLSSTSLQSSVVQMLSRFGNFSVHTASSNSFEHLSNGLFLGKSGVLYTSLRLFDNRLPSLSGHRFG